MANIINFSIHTITMTITALYAMAMPWKKHEEEKNLQIVKFGEKNRNHNVQHYTQDELDDGHPEK